MIDEPDKVTKSQMDKWANDFDSWDICDQCCNNLFVDTPYAHEKAIEWSESKKEFVKRAGFTMMAVVAVHDKDATDKDFDKFFERIKNESTDERNFVKKAVNWALRQIGKRNKSLNKKALTAAKEIEKMDSKSAKWIAKDAIRELTDPKIISRIK
jgi:3-methyladenine DNA glycosylase AlkD